VSQVSIDSQTDDVNVIACKTQSFIFRNPQNKRGDSAKCMQTTLYMMLWL